MPRDVVKAVLLHFAILAVTIATACLATYMSMLADSEGHIQLSVMWIVISMCGVALVLCEYTLTLFRAVDVEQQLDTLVGTLLRAADAKQQSDNPAALLPEPVVKPECSDLDRDSAVRAMDVLNNLPATIARHDPEVVRNLEILVKYCEAYGHDADCPYCAVGECTCFRCEVLATLLKYGVG